VSPNKITFMSILTVNQMTQ